MRSLAVLLLCLTILPATADRRGAIAARVQASGGGGGSPTFPANSVAYWKMDEASGTRVDHFTGNDLAEVFATVEDRSGVVNAGADFAPATFAHLEASDSADLSMGADVDFSISAWFNSDAAPNFQYIYAKNDAAGGGEEYNLRLLSGEGSSVRFSVWRAAGTTEEFDSTATFSSATLYHVVVTYDQSNIRIYINGALDSTHAFTDDVRDTASPLAFGFDVENGFRFDGLVDETGIWKRVLSLSEVQDLYNAGAGIQP